MRIIVHSPQAAFTFSNSSFSFLLKLGYILSDETVSIGFAELNIGIMRELKIGSKEFKFKIMLIGLHPEIYAEVIENTNDYFTLTKEYNKIKHKTTDQLKGYLSMERIIVDYYNEWEINKKEDLEKKGYTFLLSLMEGKILSYYYLKEDYCRKGNDVKQLTLDMESLFRLTLPDTKCKKSLLAFHDVFLNKTALKEDSFVLATDIAASDTNNSYFHYVASITHLNNLSETEIRAIRLSFINKLHCFRNKIDEWSELCNTSTDYTASLEYFKENIIPVLPDVDLCFKEDKILKYKNIIPEDTAFYLYIGEITKIALLNYYVSAMPITPEDRKVLEDKFIADGDYARRIPMMIISDTMNLQLPLEMKEEAEESTELTKRKFIAIED